MKALQILTLALLAIAIVFNSILKIYTEPHDLLAINILKATVVGSGLWLAFIVVFSVIRGFGVNPLASILNKLRELFGIRSFLIVSIIVFTFTNSFLVYQLTSFRQVEFIADKKMRLYENQKAGVISEIGILNDNSPKKFRLKNGDHFIFYEILENGKKGSIEKLKVLPFWKEQQMKRIKTDNIYEKL